MDVFNTLKGLYTAQAVKKVLKTVNPAETTVRDLVFGNKQIVESPLVPLAELKTVIKNMPVVSRDGNPLNVSGDDMNVTYIEPLPVKLFVTINPVTMNNLKVSGLETFKSYVNRQIVNLRESTNLTTEALCSQAAFDGGISYQLQTDSGSSTYSVTYGGEINTVNVSAADKWDAEGAGRTVVLKLLRSMDTKMNRAGYPGKRLVFAGLEAFGKLMDLADSQGDDRTPIRIKDDGSIHVGKFIVHEMSEVYTDATGASKSKIADNEIRMVTPAYAALYYAALDDMDANLQALPFFIKVIKNEFAGSLVNVSNSKPLPGVATGSICKAVVTAPPA